MKRCLNCQTPFESAEWACPTCAYHPVSQEGVLCFAPELSDSSDGFEAGFFPRLAEIEEGYWWFRARNELVIWATRKWFSHAQNFLEVGCGTGYVLLGMHRAFPAMALSGSEIFQAGLGFAQQRLPKASLFQMDARAIPFEQEFDLVGAFDVLEHIPEDTLALSQLYRALKPGGGLLISVPQHPELWSVVDTYSHHQRRYTEQELTQKVTDAGFKVLDTTSFVSILLPAMLISRRRHGDLRPEDYDPLVEFALNPVLNTLFKGIMTVERMGTFAGLRYPAGGSRLMIAQRPPV
jgi:SAM-dependent methyltransferase